MTDATETTAAAAANGKTDAKPRPGPGKTGIPAEPKAEPVTAAVIEGKPIDEECEQCGEPGKAATGLGLLICAVAGGLLYIGIDLITGGGLSRKLSGTPEDDSE